MALLLLLLLTSLLSHIGHCAYVDMGIVNGSVAKPHSRPYMVSIQKDGSHRCGGFLLSEYFVMTAAHCWEAGEKLTVVVGAHKLQNGKSALGHMEVMFYHIHPKYNSDTLASDIMLLQLKKSIKKIKNVNWISIPNKMNEDTKAKQVCSIAGWGKLFEKSSLSSQLMEVKVTVIDTELCGRKWKGPFPVSSVICTSVHGGFCQGDSGGPLVCQNKAVGIISFYDLDCTSPKSPYVYTKISAYLPWIKCILGSIE